MSPLVWIGAAGASAWIYKKRPEWLPRLLQPKAHAQKVAALGMVTATSVPTPSDAHGLDPHMTSTEVASANGLLQNATDPNALYAMASDYSERGHVETARALIAKADALAEAKKHGAADDELFNQMMVASIGTHPATEDRPGVTTSRETK